jgi:hypothetical protein
MMMKRKAARNNRLRCNAGLRQTRALQPTGLQDQIGRLLELTRCAGNH